MVGATDEKTGGGDGSGSRKGSFWMRRGRTCQWMPIGPNGAGKSAVATLDGRKAERKRTPLAVVVQNVILTEITELSRDNYVCK